MKNNKSFYINLITINIVDYFRRKLCVNLCGIIAYVSLPFIPISIAYYWIFIGGGLWGNDDKFYFITDYTNSFLQPIVLISTYFLCGNYCSYCKTTLEKLQQYLKKNFDFYRKKCYIFLKIIIIPLSFGGLFFVNVAKSNSNMYWMSCISDSAFFCYHICICLTFYFTLNVTLEVLYTCKTFYSIFNIKNLMFDMNAADGCMGYKDCLKILITNLAIGFAYFLGCVLMMLTDYTSYVNYNIDDVFHKYSFSIFPLLAILIFVLTIIITPLWKLKVRIAEQKMVWLEQINRQSEKAFIEKDFDKYNALKDKKEYIYHLCEPATKSVESKLTIMLSLLIPILGIILQGIELYRNIIE